MAAQAAETTGNRNGSGRRDFCRHYRRNDLARGRGRGEAECRGALGLRRHRTAWPPPPRRDRRLPAVRPAAPRQGAVGRARRPERDRAAVLLGREFRVGVVPGIVSGPSPDHDRTDGGHFRQYRARRFQTDVLRYRPWRCAAQQDHPRSHPTREKRNPDRHFLPGGGQPAQAAGRESVGSPRDPFYQRTFDGRLPRHSRRAMGNLDHAVDLPGIGASGQAAECSAGSVYLRGSAGMALGP